MQCGLSPVPRRHTMVQPVSRSGIEGRVQLPSQQATTPDRRPAPHNSPVMIAPDPPASAERIVLLLGGLDGVAQPIGLVEGGAQDASDAGKTPPDLLRAAVEWRPRECSICLGEICRTDRRGVAHPAGGCSHAFHWDCLCDWLVYKSTCPNCRRPLHKFGVCEITGAQDIESDADLNSSVKLHVPTKCDGQDAATEGQLNTTQRSSNRQGLCATREQRAAWMLVVVLCIGVIAFVLTILLWDSGSVRRTSRLHGG